MNDFTSLGITILVGMAAGKLIGKIKVPSVAGFIVAGLILGVSGLNITNAVVLDRLSFISDFALGIIAFNIGSEFEIEIIRKLGKSIFIIALFESLGAFALVAGSLMFFGQDIPTSLVLGSVAAATAPAATTMVIRELKAKGPLTSTLLGVIAVDDAICLMIYSISAALAKVFINHQQLSISKIIIFPLMEILFSIIAGFIIGFVLSYIISHNKRSDDTLTYILGSIILLLGISQYFNLSPLLSTMAMGITVANLVADKRFAFDQIETFSTPLIATFFILAGSRLDIALIPQLGIAGLVYLLSRIVGKTLGAYLGGTISKAPDAVRKYIGFGLYSQVGVAVGLAITISREFSGTNLGDIVITILLATTIVTEILGPISTKNAIIKAKEAH